MHPRRRRLITASAALIAALAAPLVVAGPAAADETACEGGYRMGSGYELVKVEERFVPPPLRGSGWDCASAVAGRDFEGAGSVQYTLYWVGIDAAGALDILERFERAGWTEGDEGTIASNAAGREENGRMGVADLRAWDPLPGAINVRFGNIQTGHDIIHFFYGDGEVSIVDPGLGDVPLLMVDVIVTESYTATGAADPSVLDGLRTIAEATPTGTQAAVLGGTAVFLTLLVGLPGYLVDRVLDRRWTRFRAWVRARRARLRGGDGRGAKGAADAASGTAASAAPAPPAARVRQPLPSWLVWPGFAVAAFIACFIDPSFGPNPLSLRLYLTVFASLALVNVVGWFVAAAVIRRLQPEARPRIVFRWGSLALVAVTVLIARLLQFEPGTVFGIVAGLTFAVTLAASRDALVILVGSATALVLAIFAWVGYSAFAPVVDSMPDAVVLRALVELMSAVVVEGVSTLPLALLPLAALDGAVIFAWRRTVWVAAYLVGVAAFGFVMLTVPEAWSAVQGDYLHWLLVFVGFAVLAVGAWGLDLALERRRLRRRAAAVAEDDEVPAVG